MENTRNARFSPLSWGAIFASLAVGLGVNTLLMMIGVAAGLTATQATDATEGVSIATGIWTGLSMLISAFIGGYVAARLSGLKRRSDGILHGLVAWGATLLTFAFLATTATGNMLGSAFSVFGQNPNIAAQVSETGVNIINKQGGDANPNVSPNASSEARITTEEAVETAAAATWWLFLGSLLAMLLSIWGGSIGVHPRTRLSDRHGNRIPVA